MTDMKMQDMKLQDMKLQDLTNIFLLFFLPIPVILAVLWFDVIFTVNCSLAAALSTRIDRILLNFSFFSCIVMLTLQQWNCVM